MEPMLAVLPLIPAAAWALAALLGIPMTVNMVKGWKESSHSAKMTEKQFGLQAKQLEGETQAAKEKLAMGKEYMGELRNDRREERAMNRANNLMAMQMNNKRANDAMTMQLIQSMMQMTSDANKPIPPAIDPNSMISLLRD